MRIIIMLATTQAETVTQIHLPWSRLTAPQIYRVRKCSMSRRAVHGWLGVAIGYLIQHHEKAHGNLIGCESTLLSSLWPTGRPPLSPNLTGGILSERRFPGHLELVSEADWMPGTARTLVSLSHRSDEG